MDTGIRECISYEVETGVISYRGRTAVVGGDVSRRSFRALYERCDQALSYLQLMNQLWPGEFSGHITRMRNCPSELARARAVINKVLETLDAPFRMKAIRGAGFRLTPMPKHEGG